jgi:hypothetical protein
VPNNPLAGWAAGVPNNPFAIFCFAFSSGAINFFFSRAGSDGVNVGGLNSLAS